MDRSTRPWPMEIGLDAFIVQDAGNFALSSPLLDKQSKHPSHRVDLWRRARHENDTIRLDAFVLSKG